MMTAARLLISLLLNILFLSYGWGKQGKPVKSTIVKVENGFTIMRNGQPYFIKGAGGTSNLEKLKTYGGNSIRTWSPQQADEILNKAQTLGLTVTLGLDVKTERHGFDYNNPAAVAKQKEYIRTIVLKYKDHPALLAWGIGNELNLHYSNPKVWDAVNSIAEMIHGLDSNHLVTTMLAGVNQKEIDYIKTRCPALDLIAVQVYGGLAAVPEQLKKTGWSKPYIVSEWGPTGHWEGLLTPWGAPIEETSHEKARVYKNRYEAAIGQDKNCLGSYVFLWGQKQERTPTWYGLFTERGEENEVVDVMQYLWSGLWPRNRAPQLDSLLLDHRHAKDFIYLESGKSYPIEVFVRDPDGDNLQIRWELLKESTDLKEGGDREERPQAINGIIKDIAENRTLLTAPSLEGAYRLFVYANDGNDKVATANIPFFVKSSSVIAKNSTYHFSPTPIWADEFNYSGLPDKNKWSYDVGYLYNGWGNNELQYYMEASASNSIVEGGVLKIMARKENKDGKAYTSARLTSKNKGDFRYGRFEARAKLPKGLGTWPAIWMLATDMKYGDWPKSGEIDILEHVGYDQGVVHVSIHSEAYNHAINTQKTSKKKVSGVSEEFHSYRVDWTPTYIKGFIDEQEIFHFVNEKRSFREWPFDQKFHWLINLAVGGNWGGREGVNDTIFPATLEIDYVRVYRLLD
ncbi:family 16 glycosylhydrolase [Sphingobacterium sp. UBA5996]|uniref:family 16 glycosylhydrolase n=1 Tax=Sphingobacterium sp. UBA5996 TaxID=1947505 RepID=UPI0025F3ADCA|nr:family 16 glycosylhydrolase [Sphingobacterium sp. UBA5996]